MLDYQKDFIDLARERGVLRFGEFVLKSGRNSPYFFNTGHFNSGTSLARLAYFYARTIVDSGLAFDALYGPAYKGIPLAAAIACSFSEHFGRDVPYSFNRKEAKDHGEGGRIVGAPLAGRVLIVDDVISAGTSSRESVTIIESDGAEPAGIAIALDRCERGTGPTSAVQQVRAELGLAVISIITLDDLVAYLADRGDMAAELRQVEAYRKAYGVTAA